MARGFRAEVGRDQRLLDIVERIVIEARPAEPREVADDPVGRLAKSAEEAVVPGCAHETVPMRWVSVASVIVTASILPMEAVPDLLSTI